MLTNITLDNQPRNYLIVSSDIKYRYESVISVISQFMGISDNKILENPDIKYVSLPVTDKTGSLITSLSNRDLLMREYGLLESIESNKVGNEITINQIRDVISFTQISAHKDKKIVILNSASNMNNEASSALLKTLEEVSSNCTFFLITSYLDSIHETIKSRCQVISHEPKFEIIKDSSFQSFFFMKHPFLMSIDKEFDIENHIDRIKSKIDGLLDKSLDPIDVSYDWGTLDTNLILHIITEYIIYSCKMSLRKTADQSDSQTIKKLTNIYNKIPIIKKNIKSNINTKFLLNNLAIELAA